MSDGFEWGPWVEHDGKGCPVPDGLWIEVIGKGRLGPRVVKDEGWSHEYAPESWDRAYFGTDAGDGWRWGLIIRYRIRRPRAVEDLARLAAQPYAPPPTIGPEGPVRQPERVPG